MPIESEANRQFFFEIDGEMKQIETGVTIEDCKQIVEDVENVLHNPEFFKGGEIEFKMSRKERKRCKKVMQLLIPRYFSNNWRKMHGLPIVRRKIK